MNIFERIDNFIQNNNVLNTMVAKVLEVVLPYKVAYAACTGNENCCKNGATCLTAGIQHRCIGTDYGQFYVKCNCSNGTTCETACGTGYVAAC